METKQTTQIYGFFKRIWIVVVVGIVVLLNIIYILNETNLCEWFDCPDKTCPNGQCFKEESSNCHDNHSCYEELLKKYGLDSVITNYNCNNHKCSGCVAQYFCGP